MWCRENCWSFNSFPLSKFSLLSTGHCSQKGSIWISINTPFVLPQGIFRKWLYPWLLLYREIRIGRDAVKLLKRLGKGCFMAKTDVKSAFRIIPIHPADYSFLVWNGTTCNILIGVLRWGFLVLVRFLKHLVRHLSGFPLIILVLAQYYIF